MKVSIIVPVYNIENEVEICIHSLLNQKYKNIEIIVVNDGSSDATLEKVKSFSSRKLKVFSTKNQGLGEARNFGLTKANGDYICFVDGDDSVEAHYVDNMVKWALKGYDIVICDYNLVFSTKNGLNPLKKIANKIVSPKRFSGVNERLILNYRYIAWNKMYKKELLNDFKWGSGAHEDINALELLFKEPNIKYIQDKLYNYYKRTNTLSTSTTTQKLVDIRNNYAQVIKRGGEYKQALMLRQYSSLLVNIVDLYKENPQTLTKEIEQLNEEFKDYCNDPKLRSKLGLAKKKYVEAGLKNDIKRLLFINKFVSK